MANDCNYWPASRSSKCTGWQNFECLGVPNRTSIVGSTTQVLNRPSCSSSFRKRHCATHIGHLVGYGSHPWCMYLVPYWQQWAWGLCYVCWSVGSELVLFKGRWRDVQKNQLLPRFRTGWGKRLPAGGHGAEARYMYVCGLFIIIHHCYSNLEYCRVMHPNTVHRAVTLLPSICYGEHFFSSSTMRDTLGGIIHSFVDHIKITNTNHPPVASLLRYIARFYHSGLIELGPEAFTGGHQLLCFLFGRL